LLGWVLNGEKESMNGRAYSRLNWTDQTNQIDQTRVSLVPLVALVHLVSGGFTGPVNKTDQIDQINQSTSPLSRPSRVKKTMMTGTALFFSLLLYRKTAQAGNLGTVVERVCHSDG
jgi:hypothetical protein